MQGQRNLEWGPLNVSLQELVWRKIIMKTQNSPSQNALLYSVIVAKSLQFLQRLIGNGNSWG